MRAVVAACWCGTNCYQCGGDCSFGCTYSCTGNCDGCSGSCSGSCSGGCQGNCRNTCTGGCQGSCTATCANDCSSGCKGSCTQSCVGTCANACNTGCSGQATTTLYNNLTLDVWMKSGNINDIATFIYNEANRRGKGPSSVSTSYGEGISYSKINTMISNLAKAGQSISNTSSTGNISLRILGEELITKVKKAYEQIV